jgi:hypothetical protein
MDYKLFNSAEQSDYLKLTAPYVNAINPTTVLFQGEKVSAFVDSLGHIAFFDESNQSLGFVDIPAAESPDLYGHSGQYGELYCKSDGERIQFKLPVYGWDDCYPYCDGESDRWDRYVARWFYVVFDCKTRTISVQDR